MPTLLLADLIKEELALRKHAALEISARQYEIEQLINQHCVITPTGYLSREEWQDFCFRRLFNRNCHSNIPFSTYLNEIMPQLGFPLGYAHTKLSVYRGLTWK